MSEIVDVWEVRMEDQGDACVHTDTAIIAEEIKCFADELNDGRSFTVTVTKKQMTASAVDALPEFMGY